MSVDILFTGEEMQGEYSDDELERIRREFEERAGEGSARAPAEVTERRSEARIVSRTMQAQRSTSADEQTDEELLWVAVHPGQGTQPSRTMAQHQLIDLAIRRNDHAFWEKLGVFLLDCMANHNDVGHRISDRFAENCPDEPFAHIAQESVRDCRYNVWRKRAQAVLDKK